MLLFSQTHPIPLHAIDKEWTQWRGSPSKDGRSSLRQPKITARPPTKFSIDANAFRLPRDRESQSRK